MELCRSFIFVYIPARYQLIGYLGKKQESKDSLYRIV